MYVLGKSNIAIGLKIYKQDKLFMGMIIYTGLVLFLKAIIEILYYKNITMDHFKK